MITVIESMDTATARDHLLSHGFHLVEEPFDTYRVQIGDRWVQMSEYELPIFAEGVVAGANLENAKQAQGRSTPAGKGGSSRTTGSRHRRR